MIQSAWQLSVDFFGSKPVVVEPSAVQVSSDGGLLPFRQLDERLGTAHPTLGAADDVAGVVRRLREAFPGVRIHLHGDSGFGTPWSIRSAGVSPAPGARV
jgi:hypothetical protein